jgi:hypothetical protein
MGNLVDEEVLVPVIEEDETICVECIDEEVDLLEDNVQLSKEENKKVKGQYFTTTNPFCIDVFHKWYKTIPNNMKEKLLEPFAGSNNLVKMIGDLNINKPWDCFDIEPSKENVCPTYKIKKRDTIEKFPKGYNVCITNPPYLAKNSATRSGIAFPDCEFDDLYKLCLDIMLKNVDYVAAIVPESFISANLFHDRLFAFVSLTCKMFEDTECPVCLTLFVPTSIKEELKLEKDDFFVYRQNKRIGKYSALEKKKPVSSISVDWKFNDKDGIIGIKCIDGLDEPSIAFVKGEEIEPDKVKVSSRSLTRVSGLPNNIDIEEFLRLCNKKLYFYRKDTSDVFLTCFKGLRKDGKYRRRLDFANAKAIMNSVIEELNKTN